MGHSISSPQAIPPYPGLVYLCGPSIVGASDQGHRDVNWYVSFSEDEIALLVAYYRDKLGDEGFTHHEKGGGFWRFPINAGEVQEVLDLLPIEAEDPHHHCGGTIPSLARSVVIISQSASLRSN